MKADMQLAQYVESFFQDRLGHQLQASECTIRAYRDALKLFFCHVAGRLDTSVQKLRFDDISREAILEFLDHLECNRGNTVRTRNARLAAIRSFFAHITTVDPARMAEASRVMSIPSKKAPKRTVGYLTTEEINALLTVPNRQTCAGRRLYLLLLFLLRTGARVSEVAAVNRDDVRLSTPYQVLIHGKGNKDRCVPLSAELAGLLRTHLGDVSSDTVAVFVNSRGVRLTRHGIAHLLRVNVDKASKQCASLKGRAVSPHVLRSTTAMCLLRAGVDLTTIRSWLGHCSVETTHLYVEADLKMKEQALAACNHKDEGFIPYQPPDELLSFLESL